MYSSRVRAAALEALGQGRTLSEISRSSGVSRSALRVWREGPAAAHHADCPRCEGQRLDPRPYSALLGYYLGDGTISRAARCLVLRISCDASCPGIIDDVQRSLLESFPSRRVHRVKAPGVVVVQAAWVHWACVFPQHGPGRKHERPIRLAEWQRECIEAHPEDFLRGLFHSDGCRAVNSVRRRVGGKDKVYTYPRWQFVNHSSDIRELCGEALDLLQIPWRPSSRFTISVSTRPAVARLDAAIGRKA